MPRKPFKKGEARPAKAGRRAGTPNRVTAVAKETIEAAAEALGGFERLAKWAKASKKNEYAFWTVIYPKLLPLHVHGPGQHGAPVIEIAKEDLQRKLEERGLPQLTFGEDVPVLD